jgi:4-amino-4-deoxy-L-arabinose transferase-like glycosyltransferase
LVCAFVLALAFRIGLALTLQERLYWPDSNWYFNVAERIAAGQGFGQSLTRGPVYPYFLSLILLFSSRLVVIRICESILSAFVCVLMGLLGKKLFSERVGLLAAFASAVYPYFVYLPSAQGSDNIVTLLFLVSILFLVGNGISLSLRNCLLSGFFLGLSLLARPSIAAAIPGILVWPVFLRRRPGVTVLFRNIVITVAVALATVVPWTIHNYVVTGQFVFIATSGGRQFWCGNVASATNITTDENPVCPPELAQKLASLPDEVAREKLFYKEGLASIREHPKIAIKLYFRKLANLFQLFPLVRTPGTGPERSVVRTMVKLGSLVLFVFSFLGALLVVIKRSFAAVLPLIFISYCLGSAVLLTVMRYRLPVDPYIILLGSAALAFFLRWPSTLSSSERP